MKQKSHEKPQIKVSYAKKSHTYTSYINICLVGSKGARQGHLDQDFSHFCCRNGVNAVNATFTKTEKRLSSVAKWN
jgi:hypothetical protein